MSEASEPGTSEERERTNHTVTERATYAAAGVDIEAGDKAVELMKASVAKASRPEVVGGLGGFAGLFRADALKGMARPLLATATDGVGTKVAVAQRMDVHDTVGIDLVAMVMDDLVVCGAEPLFMTDYIACGKVLPERIAAIVAGIAEGCRRAGCALVGGETAEHPGLLGPDEYDLAGAGTGVVDEPDLIGAQRVRAGDVVIAMASSGLHSNGYSLARHVFFAGAGWDVHRQIPEFGRTLGEELLEPTRIYSLDCLSLLRAGPQQEGPHPDGPRGPGTFGPALEVHALCHVTGGGLAANLERVLPEDLDADLDRASWTPSAVFDLLGSLGSVAQLELERTLNMGVGMVAVVAPAAADAVLARLAARDLPSWVLGEITPGTGQAALHGSHR